MRRRFKSFKRQGGWLAINALIGFGAGDSAPPPVDYLVVGGGAGGRDTGSGGGGGGYVAMGTKSDIVIGTSYTVTVGAGGAKNSNGNSSVFSTVTSLGGNGGLSIPNYDGGAGGSGGGGYSLAGVAGAGGTNGGNGGTATAPGGVGQGTTTTSSISGSSVAYGPGGGAGTDSGTVGVGGATGGGRGASTALGAAVAGTANTGGGGGGGNPSGANNAAGGGSGVVIIRYSSSYPDITTIGAGLTYSYSNSGGFKTYTFTAGTDNINF